LRQKYHNSIANNQISTTLIFFPFICCSSAIPVKNSTAENVVVFGDHNSLTSFWQNSDTSNTILVPLDSSVLKGTTYQIHSTLTNDFFPATPENSYVITLNYHEQLNYTPNPSLFEIAAPLVVYAQNLKHFITGTCNDTTDKLKCLRNKFQGTPQSVLRPSQIADLLKIETSSINYYVYKSENSSLPRKIFSYNIFSNNLTLLDNTVELGNASEPGCKSDPSSCQKQCKNFASRSSVGFIPGDCEIRIRSESWVFAFLSLSLLGVLFCIAILIFLLVSICRRNVLEGNPVLTMLLLVAVMLMFCSILPLSLEGDKSTKESICLARALAITLSFSAAFSLILSRSILLATASKEIGFMSHVAGPVQSFLCLFIFGVQAALSLQVVNRCSDIFRGYSFVYLLSYNAMLLLLLLCLCPLIVKCQRNYKEGKYFTWAVATISILWCVWIPAYALVDQQYKDSVLCFGLVSTASALMATIFVPRTYLMTIAAARDKITSTLPSLSGATSAMDIYRAGAQVSVQLLSRAFTTKTGLDTLSRSTFFVIFQPVYDCVNVAAINAVTVARAGVTPIQQPDLYSCPNLPEDDDFDVRCATPIDDDKVTRF
jgi:hypothetical protein